MRPSGTPEARRPGDRTDTAPSSNARSSPLEAGAAGQPFELADQLGPRPRARSASMRSSTAWSRSSSAVRSRPGRTTHSRSPRRGGRATTPALTERDRRCAGIAVMSERPSPTSCSKRARRAGPARPRPGSPVPVSGAPSLRSGTDVRVRAPCEGSKRGPRVRSGDRAGLFAPECVDEPVGGEDHVGMGEQPREEGPLSERAEVHRASVSHRLERPQDPELQRPPPRSTVPPRSTSMSWST